MCDIGYEFTQNAPLDVTISTVYSGARIRLGKRLDVSAGDLCYFFYDGACMGSVEVLDVVDKHVWTGQLRSVPIGLRGHVQACCDRVAGHFRGGNYMRVAP